MPTHKVKNGYKWGKNGKVYPTKKQADKQGQAIYANGWKEKKNINEAFSPYKILLIGIIRKTHDELCNKGYNENIINNYINIDNIQITKENENFIFYFQNNPIFKIDSIFDLDDMIIQSSNELIKWFSENKKTNECKKMNNKKIIRLTESDLHNIIKESVNRILFENEDDFTPHGYKGTSNFGGYEMQIDNRGEMARLKDSHTGNITDWMEIQFDEEGVAYVIDENGNEEKLCDYMRY